MRVLYVTGSNEEYFLTLLAFLESLSGRIDRSVIRVCDFGLNPGQRSFLKDAGMLLERPSVLPTDAHPYLCKGHLLEYLAPETWDAALWLDADMLIGALEPTMIAALAEKLCNDGKFLAASPHFDGQSFAQVLNDLAGQGRNVAPALNLLKRVRADADLPYLTAGLMLFVDKRFMREWMVACRTTPPHVLWEQNVLNAMISRTPEKVEHLPPVPWQISDVLLADIELPARDRPYDLRHRGAPVIIAHATSQRNYYLDGQINMKLAGLKVKGYIRLFAKPELHKLQLANLQTFIEKHRNDIIAAGALPEAEDRPEPTDEKGGPRV
jgi:hypothetical protein